MKYLILHVYIIFYCACVCTGVVKDGYSNTLNREQNVTLKHRPGHSDHRFPERYDVWFQYGDDHAHFELSRDDVITRALSPALFQLSYYLPDNIMTYDNTDHFAFYHNEHSVDSETKAYFVVYRPKQAKNATFYGQIISKNNTFQVQPNKLGSNSYKIIQNIKPDTHNTKGKYNVIELLVWIAPDLYEFHNNRLTATTTKVDEWLQSYAKSLIREVDRVYRKITTIPVRAYFIGANIDKNMETASWFTDNTQRSHILNADGALLDFTSHLTKMVHYGLVPKHDHALLLTRKQLNDRSKTGQLKIAHGKAKSICSSEDGSSVSIASVGSTYFLKAVMRSIGIGFGLTEEDDYNLKDAEESKKRLLVTMDTSIQEISPFGQIKLARHFLKLTDNCLKIETNKLEFHAFIKSTSFRDQPIETQCEIVFGSESSRCTNCRFGKCTQLARARMTTMMTSTFSPFTSSYTSIPSTFVPAGSISTDSAASSVDPITASTTASNAPTRPSPRIIDVTTTNAPETTTSSFLPFTSSLPPYTSLPSTQFTATGSVSTESASSFDPYTASSTTTKEPVPSPRNPLTTPGPTVMTSSLPPISSLPSTRFTLTGSTENTPSSLDPSSASVPTSTTTAMDRLSTRISPRPPQPIVSSTTTTTETTTTKATSAQTPEASTLPPLSSTIEPLSSTPGPQGSSLDPFTIMSTIPSSTVDGLMDDDTDDAEEQRQACACCRRCRCRSACDKCRDMDPSPRRDDELRGPPDDPATRPMRCKGPDGCCRRHNDDRAAMFLNSGDDT